MNNVEGFLNIIQLCNFLNVSNSRLYQIRLTDHEFPKPIRGLDGTILFKEKDILE